MKHRKWKGVDYVALGMAIFWAVLEVILFALQQPLTALWGVATVGWLIACLMVLRSEA